VLVLLALGALGAALALLMAHLQFPVLANVLVGVAATCGLLAFATALAATIRRARQLPPGPGGR
jgi:hypothetical protein